MLHEEIQVKFMKNLTLANIAKACGGVYHGPENKKDIQVSSITTDSRQIQPEGLFVPIAGERVDGHTFIPQVMEKPHYQKDHWKEHSILTSRCSLLFRQ